MRRNGPATGPDHRRGRSHHRSAPVVRRSVARGQLDRRPHRPGAAGPHPGTAPGHPATRHRAGTGRGLQRQQLSAGLLGRRRRHRLGAGRWVSCRRQGTRCAPGHFRAGGPGHHRCRPHGRPARGHLLAAVRVRSWVGHRPGDRPQDQGRRFHRIPFRRNSTGCGGGSPARAHPGVCGNEFGQPRLPATRCALGTRRRAR